MQTLRVIIIGSGFGGQCAAIMLRRRGIEDFRILERREFMGGTWCQNTYPGAAVDVQSPLYSLSFEPFPWSQMFAEQSELQRYTRFVIDKHGLRDVTDTGTAVEEVRWDQAERRWAVKTSRGEYRAKFIINASGPLSTPSIPDFPGRETFGGASFHTNDWDHSVDCRGARVAVIGSGASAAQVIPAVAEEVAALHVFQRTPHWVLPRPDHQFSPLERALLSLPPVYRAVRSAIYWGLEWRVIGMKYSQTMLKLVAQRKALRMLAEQVPDPALRRQLTPEYTIGCKRILLSNTLLPALGLPSTTLHGRTDGVREINEAGIVTGQGDQVDLDVIVYATGYDVTDDAISYPVVGRGGLSLGDVWSDYPRAYLGTAVPGFPNLFVVTGPNTGIGHTSALFIIESQMAYIMDAIGTVEGRGLDSIEVRAEAEEAYTAKIHAAMVGTVWESGGCDSWYKHKSGKVIAMFPGFSFTYRWLTRKVDVSDHVLA